MSDSFLDTAVTVLGWSAVIATAAAALFGSLLWFLTNIQSARKDEALAKFKAESSRATALADQKAAEAQEGTAKALADAAKSASEIAGLNKQAEALRLEAVEARKEIAGTTADAAKANERAEALELETAQQREKAALAESALLELQRRVQDRHLTPEQREILASRFSLDPKGEISVACLGGSPEPCAFAVEFVELLQTAGWTVEFGSEQRGVLIVGGSVKGLLIEAQREYCPRGAALQRALRAAGLDVGAKLAPDKPKDSIELFVGSKP